MLLSWPLMDDRSAVCAVGLVMIVLLVIVTGNVVHRLIYSLHTDFNSDMNIHLPCDFFVFYKICFPV